MIERNPGAVYHDGVPNGRSGYTPLHYAARAGHMDCVSLLLRSGAPVHARTSAGGATPLMRAAFAGHTNVCKTLLRAGAPIDAQDSDGETALHKAARQRHAGLLAILQEACPSGAAELLNRHGQRAADLLALDADS